MTNDEGVEELQPGYMQYPPYGASPVQHPYAQSYNPAETSYEKDETTDYAEGKGHTHGHLGATTCQAHHVHMHPGVTGKPIGTEQGHIHKLTGYTTFDDGHTHYYEAYTSAPIALPGGFHTHYVEFQTTFDDGHQHTVKGFTQPSKS